MTWPLCRRRDVFEHAHAELLRRSAEARWKCPFEGKKHLDDGRGARVIDLCLGFLRIPLVNSTLSSVAPTQTSTS